MNFNLGKKIVVAGIQYAYVTDSFDTFIYNSDNEFVRKVKGNNHSEADLWYQIFFEVDDSQKQTVVV